MLSAQDVQRSEVQVQRHRYGIWSSWGVEEVVQRRCRCADMEENGEAGDVQRCRGAEMLTGAELQIWKC